MGHAIDCFFLHAFRLGRGQFLVQLIELLGDDVLFFVDPEDLVFLLVTHQLFLGCFHFHLQVHQLFRKPVGGLHGGFKLGLEVLLHVSSGESIHDAGRQCRIGAAVVNLDNARVRNQRDLQVPLEASQQCRCTFGIILQWVRHQVGLRGGLTAILRTLVEVQLANHL